ncbi:hypothetical protein, partial [Salmonella sp. SAL4360]|uniref:hypothetical protein n=1 Tax=Salmonella sp. SAL4360 TaxID=3159881 RepID=UPI003979F589
VWVRAALLLPGLVVPFVPFTFGVSPLRALEELPGISRIEWIFVLLGGAFFIASPLIAWRLRMLLMRSAPRTWERVPAWVIAVTSMLIPIA